MPNKTFSPREFLKARRPEKFSDSTSEEMPALDRSMLEYHLETLTSRNQEALFENFARRLAQCEVCPNLLPHTGPTGGGDSKVDSETFPVADALSLVWFSGIGRDAGHERWAFAFSAMKEWRPKLQSDIAKIAVTRRDYRKAFFVSNQFIADRVRAEIEDRLTKKHGFDVRVLDRNWILDRVFVGRHEAIAIEELKLQTSVRIQQRKGPLDLKKETELQVIESRIKAASEEGRHDYLLVVDCIEAVELARGLELPRTQIEGLVTRAKRVAHEYGTRHQQLLAAYQWAWTAFWWFEDYETFSDQYSEVEKYATGSENVYDLELLFNLWGNLRTADIPLRPEVAKLGDRTRTLAAELDRMKHQPEKASAALQAETLHLLMDLLMCPLEKSDPLLKQFENIFERCEGLVGFPLEPIVQILIEFGDFLNERPAYERLHEKIVEMVDKRSGELSASRLLLQRGAQLLDSESPYQAIQSLGKALTRLYKHESRNDLIKALYLCGNAYEQVGLRWAAHGAMLTAASIAVSDFWTYEEITSAQAACFKRLKWFELRLGRLPHCIVWHETAMSAQTAIQDKGYDVKGFLEEAVLFDSCLAILMLKCDLWQLKQMTRLPETLEGLGLEMSAATLKFALGHICDLPEGLALQGSEILDFFKKLRSQPASAEIAESPQLYSERRVALASKILGCNVRLEVDNISPCIELAESVLAALEALLATGMEHRLFAREPILKIRVRKSDFVEPLFEYAVKEHEGRPSVEIRAGSFHAHKMTHEAQRKLKDKLIELLITILAEIFVLDVSKQSLEDLFCNEHALARSVDFTSSFVTLGNVLGYAPKTNLDSWIDANSKEYPLTRVEEWDASERKLSANTTPNKDPEISKDAGDSSPSLWQGKASHSEMETISFIRLALWDRAKWTGTFFMWPMDTEYPPLLALLFESADAGIEIFSHWQKELGKVDERDRLRLTVIRGISKRNAHAYRVVVGSNPDRGLTGGGSKLFFMVNRMNTMEPSSGHNLTAFLAQFNLAKAYYLAPAVMNKNPLGPKPIVDKCVLKHELNVRQAWEIGPNDIDSPGIRSDDDPFIPDGQRNAPVLELIQWLKCHSRAAD